MPENLFAACRINGELVCRLVRLDGTIQKDVEEIFAHQAEKFFEGVDEEVPFDGRWKPDENEVLTLEVTPEAEMLRDTLNRNPIAVEPLDLASFATVGVKALFTGEGANDAGRVLVQQFTAGQVLDRKFAVVLQGNSFRRLTAPAFTLASSLASVIDGGLIKFKSFSNLRAIFDVTEIYRDATDQELRDFAGHSSLRVADLEDFMLAADQVTRKLINAVVASGVLDAYSPSEIQEAAVRTRLNVELEGGCIVLPAERRKVKNLLQFLDEGRYNGPLSGRPYVTNSRKLAPQAEGGLAP